MALGTVQQLRPDAVTAYGCLEEAHWDVAKAAIRLAEAAVLVLQTASAGDDLDQCCLDKLRDSLTEFREIAARPI